jgi:phosphate/sulfate permease
LSFGGFCFAFILFVLLSFSFVKENDKRTQYNDQRKNEKKTNNIMAKGKRKKDKQYKGQRKTTKGQTV